MKILNVNHSLDPIKGGGTAERTYQMSKYLAGSGIICSILTLDIGLTAERRQQLKGVNIVALPCISERFYFPRPTLSMLKSVIRSVQSADLVHIMNHWTIINVLAYLTARRLHKPYVVCPAGALPVFGRSKFLKAVYNWLFGYRIVRNAVFCIAVTADEIPQFQSYGVNADRIIIIPNGINEDDYNKGDEAAFRTKHQLGDKQFILFIGRLNPIKGPDLLLRAFGNAAATLKNYQLVFAGPDEGMLAWLREFAEKNMIAERVRFIGFVSGAEKSQAYRAATLLVIPSRKDAMSIVVLEAGMAGTPVLITDQCGLDEIESIKGGKVVSATVEGLQAGLIGMLSDKDTLKTMGKNLNIFVRENFQWNIVINKYIQIYNQILMTVR